jgi:ribosomal protein S18 acetylase RimI-like enzyme
MIIELTNPETAEEFEAYYDLRWRILRGPWDQPRGSERDEHEAGAAHVMAREDGSRVVGVGRGHLVSPCQAQIRYMAVEPDCRGRGIGAAILLKLEARLREGGAKEIMLNAREGAVKFYEGHGYAIVAPAPTLFDVILHFRMTKPLSLLSQR